MWVLKCSVSSSIYQSLGVDCHTSGNACALRGNQFTRERLAGPSGIVSAHTPPRLVVPHLLGPPEALAGASQAANASAGHADKRKALKAPRLAVIAQSAKRGRKPPICISDVQLDYPVELGAVVPSLCIPPSDSVFVTNNNETVGAT